VGRAGLLELLMEGEHPIHQGDHAIMAGDIGGILFTYHFEKIYSLEIRIKSCYLCYIMVFA